VVVLLSAMMVLYGPAGGDVLVAIDVEKPAEKNRAMTLEKSQFQ